jgi:hypothetical protein
LQVLGIKHRPATFNPRVALALPPNANPDLPVSPALIWVYSADKSASLFSAASLVQSLVLFLSAGRKNAPSLGRPFSRFWACSVPYVELFFFEG